MGTAPQFVFPGAIIGSVILAMFAFFVTAGASSPIAKPVASSGNTLFAKNDVGYGLTDSEDDMAAQAAEQAADQNEAEPADDSDQDRSGCKVSRNYPEDILQWCDLITKFGRNTGLDPDLIAALVWQESGGNPSAYSKSGAVGLMQVMPRDGIAESFMCQSGSCFRNRPSIEELQDPKFNIKYGTGMLANLFGRYGDMREALKYYGPMDVGYYYADKVLGIYHSYQE
jgi:hypothetical protein